MSTPDFTTYSLSNKTIRVLEDAKEKNHKYVVEDVMCVFFDNGHKYWKELKQQLSAADLSSPSAYTIIITKRGTIDVATREQLLQIISYIPHRKSKKGMVKVWLENLNDPKTIHINTKPKKQRQSNKDGQVNEPDVFNHGNDNNSYQNDDIEWWVPVVMALILIILGLATKSVFPFLMVGVIVVLMLFQFFISKLDSEPDIAEHNPKRSEKKKSNPNNIPQELIDKINFILHRRLLTYEEKEKIINDSLIYGVYLTVTQDYIDDALKRRISSFTNVELTKCVKCREKLPEDIEQCPFCGSMQILPEIKKLTALAISDRVLTDLERETIVNKAVESGISREEINQYLDDQLNLRLESYTKVDPGEYAENITNEAFNITSAEADIIRSENLRIEEEKRIIKVCPDCGAPYPLISNTCELCGHVLYQRDENSPDFKSLLANMQSSIKRLTNAPKPTLYQIIGHWGYYITLIISIFVFITSIIADSEVGKIISLSGFIVFISAIFLHQAQPKPKSPVWIADGEYHKARRSYEMFAREIDTLYVNDYEAQKMLSHFSSIIKQLKRERYQKLKKVGIIVLISTCVIMGLITFFGANGLLHNLLP